MYLTAPITLKRSALGAELEEKPKAACSCTSSFLPLVSATVFLGQAGGPLVPAEVL